MRRSYTGLVLGFTLAGTAAGQVLPRASGRADARARLDASELRIDQLQVQAERDEQRLTVLVARSEAEEALAALDAVTATIREERPGYDEERARRIARSLVRAARDAGVDPMLLAAVAQAESRFDPGARSPAGAQGLLQLMPAAGRAMSGQAAVDLCDLDTNTTLGARLVAYLLRTHATLETALLAYNRGPEGARRLLESGGGRAALTGYPRRVLELRDRLQQRVRSNSPSDSVRPAQATE